MKTPPTPPAPWYRHRWPWLLMAGPAIVVVAGFITLYLAVSGSDGLVVDDYYKQGRAINHTLHRDDVARRAALSATVTVDQVNDRVEVALKRANRTSVSDALTLSLIHATRSGFDHVVSLQPTEDHYVGRLPALPVGKWNVLLEDRQKTWRLQQVINVGNRALPRIELLPLPPPSADAATSTR